MIPVLPYCQILRIKFVCDLRPRHFSQNALSCRCLDVTEQHVLGVSHALITLIVLFFKNAVYNFASAWNRSYIPAFTYRSVLI